MQYTIGTGIATVQITQKEGNVLRVETPYVQNPLDPLGGNFFLEFNPGVPVENVQALVDLIRSIAGV